ncbi:hypothetical protein TEA_012541 [Camellia sinensis var. sinensis]|uniref:Uncharacterized protein n=1 Tax=Camellia sinensis var. sinensis TaxID=542762 RepID=A0A4S4ENP9_CAMSN|nr:hypothetical protein TEA_012541 [Camellia sinensis var. sinensis]
MVRSLAATTVLGMSVVIVFLLVYEEGVLQGRFCGIATATLLVGRVAALFLLVYEEGVLQGSFCGIATTTLLVGRVAAITPTVLGVFVMPPHPSFSIQPTGYPSIILIEHIIAIKYVELGDTRSVAEALARSKHGYIVHFSLCNSDPRDYFDSQQANALKTSRDTLVETRQVKCNLSTNEAYGSLRECISEIKIIGLSDPMVKPEATLKAMNLGSNLNLGDTRSVAEALASFYAVELANEASNGNANQERLDRISQLAEIEDLQSHRDPPLATTFIKDPRDYFDSQQANALKTSRDTLVETRQVKCNLSTSEAYGSLRECISEIKIIGLSDPIVKPEAALKVIETLVAIH